MIYVLKNEDNSIRTIYNENLATEDEKAKGIALERLPEVETKEGKIAVLKADKSKEKVWYEYVEDTKVKENKQVSTFAQTLAQLTIDNKQKDTIIKNLSQTVAKLSIEVNKLKGSVE